ncbi:LOW QUALITY PROTEIN: legumain-like [Saccoglossus kowalevskii]|uniref:legumain n=1 Tax=Saccoglossus kowalevskii TaxID=10224 RepID=A0ABM0MQ52_SACKO|nr:PREDICTED: LOW QUALITY PROTEIN: legumain-like [Saccoglossus kowalevskii]
MIRLLVLCLTLIASSFALPSHILDAPEALAEPTKGVNWALIVAGSNTWGNYRHQADACHAYQILHSNGIPDERIVVMIYDDIANNDENPTPGIIINQPNGTDVYKGVLKDYTQEDVTPENFLNILQGNAAAMQGIGSGKVIASGPNDHVFVNFVDHGAPGIVAFPAGGELHANDLNDAINSMNQQQKYAKMVFYIEACESGSMFEGLLTDNINVFATTASNAQESSYACYFDDERQTYLGDVYSVKWMEDSDMADMSMETLQQQFEVVKKETNTSHVMEYGDLTMGSLALDEFQGDSNQKNGNGRKSPRLPLNAVAAPDVPMAILEHRLMAAKDVEKRIEIVKEMDKLLQMRKFVTDTVASIVKHATDSSDQADLMINTKKPTLTSHYCYKAAVRHFSDHCFSLNKNDYPLRHLYVFVNMCEARIPSARVMDAIDKVCGEQLGDFATGIY